MNTSRDFYQNAQQLKELYYRTINCTVCRTINYTVYRTINCTVYRTINYTVCRTINYTVYRHCMCALFSPEILQAGAVKVLNLLLCVCIYKLMAAFLFL